MDGNSLQAEIGVKTMEEDSGILKEMINQFVWQNGPGDMTLDQAENIAIEIHKMLRPDLWEDGGSDPDPPRPAKPPIGIMPRHIYRQKRLDDLYNVIVNYWDAEKEIPQEWLDEYVELNGDLAMYGARIRIEGYKKKTT